jgi:hypothetical protein
MTTFAVIDNNIVENIIVADTKEIAEKVTGKECIEYTEENPAQIGWTYTNGAFVAPETPTE